MDKRKVWTRCVLKGRSCCLVFQQSPKLFAQVSVGTPQGSPVSPLLFVIYISRLQLEIPFGLTPSYVHDFALTASSVSYHRNIQRLPKHYALIKASGSRLRVSFYIPKTELMHWRMKRDRDPPSHAPTLLDGELFRPKDELWWLVYRFTISVSPTPPFTKLLVQAQAIFVAIKSLSPPEMGLPPFLCHRFVS